MVDSSDDDGGVPPQFANVGRRRLEQLPVPSKEDLDKRARRFSKTLFDSNAPSTNFTRFTWIARFKYYRSIRGIDHNTLPTSQELVAFVDYMPDLIEGRGDNDIPSYRYIESGILHVRHYCVFQYPDFVLSAHDKMRIQAALKKLLLDKRATKDLTFDRKWVTSNLVVLMIRSLFGDAIKNGTESWDVLVMDCLALLLQTATAARAGDIARSIHYKGNECLTWKDIVIRGVANESDGKVSVHCSVTLRYTKGLKDTPSKNISSEFVEFSEPTANCAYVVKLLLIHALRTGAVTAISWAALRADITSRVNRNLVWTHPERPVLCSLGVGSRTLMLNNPTGIQGLSRALKKGAAQIGLLDNVRSHDIRRGAAKEVANNPHPSMGAGIEAARSMLGHSNRRTTDEYVDHFSHDVWAHRLQNPVKPGAKHALDLAADVGERPAQRRRLPTQEIDAACVEMGLDKNVPKNRVKARHHIHGRERQAMIDAELEKPGPTLHAVSLPRAPAVVAPVVPVISESVVPAAPEESALTPSLTPGVEQHPVKDLDGSHAHALQDGVQADDAIVEIVNNVDEDTTGQLLVGLVESPSFSSPRVDEVIEARPDVFATYLSQVNVYSLNTSLSHLPTCAVDGNSREPASRFMHPCTTVGCSKQFLGRSQRDQHSANYVIVLKRFPCTSPGCEKSFDSAKQLSMHRTRAHNFTARRCNIDGCPDETVFHTRDTLQVHLDKAHSGLPTVCFVEGCDKPEFATHRTLRKHIEKFHPEVPKAELDEIFHKKAAKSAKD